MEPQELCLDIPESGAVFAFGKKVPCRFHIKNDSIISAACGEEHALVATSSGRLFAFGKNDSGQLGLGHKEPGVNKPTCVKRLRELGQKAVRVACGPTHSLVTTESGKVFGCGINTDGQLTGNSTDHSEPVEIQHLAGKDVKDLAAGRSFSLVLTKQGEVFAWGSNDEGCLGCGEGVTEARDSLVQVQLPDRAVYLSAGAYHCACVLANGQVYTWGETEGGKLGRANSESQATQHMPQLAPLTSPAPTQDAGGAPPKARAVACGLKHTLVLCEDGRVFACGSGESGQLGLGTSCGYTPIFMPVLALDSLPMACVSAGECHSACVSAEAGYLYTFGDALHGKLGPSSRLGGHSNQHRPFRVGALKPIRARRAVCGNVLTLVLAAQRAPGDPAASTVAAAAANGDSDEADDPLDSMSARSPRPLRRAELAALEATGGAQSVANGNGAKAEVGGGGGLLRRRSSRSRQKYRELARSSGVLALPPVLNGDTFELVRPAMQGAPTAEESVKKSNFAKAGSSKNDSQTTSTADAISKFDQLLTLPDSNGVEHEAAVDEDEEEKEEAAPAAHEPEVKPNMERRPSMAQPTNKPEDLPELDAAQSPQQAEDRDVDKAVPMADQQPVSAPVLIETSNEQQQQSAAAGGDDNGGTQQPVTVARCMCRRQQNRQVAASTDAVEGSGAAAEQPQPQTQQDQPGAAQDDQLVVAANAGTAESAPPQPNVDAEEPPAATAAGTSGAVKGVGCGRSRRQKPQEDAASPTPKTEGAEEAVVAADAKTAESAPSPDADGQPTPKEESAATAAGTSGAVKGVGCGRSRRQKSQPSPEEAASPAVKPDGDAAEEAAVVAADAQTAESAAPAAADPDGAVVEAAPTASTKDNDEAAAAGSSEPVKGVGCGRSRRRQQPTGQQNEASAPAGEAAGQAGEAAGQAGEAGEKPPSDPKSSRSCVLL